MLSYVVVGFLFLYFVFCLLYVPFLRWAACKHSMLSVLDSGRCGFSDQSTRILVARMLYQSLDAACVRVTQSVFIICAERWKSVYIVATAVAMVLQHEKVPFQFTPVLSVIISH